MRTINLTQGKIALVDDEDFEYLNQWKWYAHLSRNENYYAARTKIKKGIKTIYWMHRVILNPQKNIQIDHINRNGLDNRKCNLRICNHSQNQSNRKSCGKSKYLGVSIDRDKYIASIGSNNKIYRLGRFEKENEAALAYNKAALLFHGEFARLNNVL